MVDLLRNLFRAALAETVPILVAQLVPALVDTIARSSRESGPSAAGATYVAVKEAAVVMNCHPATVRRLVRQGKLGRYLLENDLRIKASDIHAYMARAGAASPSIDLAERALAILGVRSMDGHDRG